jgi:hypothetical protein
LDVVRLSAWQPFARILPGRIEAESQREEVNRRGEADTAAALVPLGLQGAGNKFV